MHPVLERLARAYATGKPAADSAEIGSVTAAESAPRARRRATSLWGVMLGAVLPAHDTGVGAVPGGALAVPAPPAPEDPWLRPPAGALQSSAW
jgi:hypothetical protein